MLYEINKALESFRHPGISTNFTKLTRNAAPYYLPFLSVKTPLTIYWSINSICNLRCKMCDVGTADEEGTFYKNLRIDKVLHEVSIDKFKSVIDCVYQDKPHISFNSTEPLIYKKIGEAIEYCTSKNLESSVTTGGYLLPKKAAELAEAGLTRLNVSIDGPAEIHNVIRGRKDSFERDVEGIKLFAEESKKRGLNSEIYVNCTISNLNNQYIVPFVEEMSTLPISKINFAFLWYIDQKMAEEQNQQFGR
ncbi:MAG: radical SAM protein, partial [Bdellovibrionales bacterium]|nr:radical SAM protein [Bdellovibrionales bacterium]